MKDDNGKRFPLPPDADPDDVVRAAYDLNLDVNDAIEPSDDRPREVIYNVPGEKTFLHHVDDHLLGVSYVQFRGKTADELAEEFTDQVAVVTKSDVDDMIDEAGDDEEQLKRALGSAYLLAPKTLNKAWMKYFNKAFKHESPEVRRYGILGVGYVGWPELAEPLQKIADEDEDTTVRAAAKRMLGALKKQAKD